MVEIAPGVSLRGFGPDRTDADSLASGLVQWCVVTPDLEKTLARLESAYGVPGFLVLEPAPLFDVRLRGEPIDQRIDLALGYIGDVNVEVIRPRDDGEADLFHEFLAEHPEGGIQHLGFQVSDFDAAHAEMTAKFGPAVQEGKSGIGAHFAYFDTRATTGLHTEILWFDEAAQASVDGLRGGNPAGLGAR